MQEAPSAKSIAFSLFCFAGLAMLAGLIAFAGEAVGRVGGFCAEGGPYVIEQSCPTGVVPVISIAIPLFFVFLFGYMMSLPKTWKPLLGIFWPLLFLLLAVSFFITAFSATSSFQPVPFFVGLMMLLIGLVPTWLVLSGRKLEGKMLYPDRRAGISPQIVAGVLGLGMSAVLWLVILN